MFRGKIRIFSANTEEERKNFASMKQGALLKGGRGLDSSRLIVTYDTDGAVVVISDVFMVMGNRDESA